MTLPDASSKTVTVSRDGRELHAVAVPPEDGVRPWLVFSNSLVTDLTIWDAQAEALRGRYGILRYDQAGHGGSGVPDMPVDFDMLGADLLAVMDAAGVECAVYIGLSMGVPTGLAAHKQAANRIRALVLSDGQAKTAPGGAAGWLDRIAMARSAGMEAFAAATADRWLTESAPVEMRKRLARMIAATPFKGFEACAMALMDYDYVEELARITCPTLLIAGSEDGAMPESMATKLKPAIAGSKMDVIGNAGHVPCFEQPEAFTAILSDFLATNFGDAST